MRPWETICQRFQVLTAASIKTVFRDVARCSLVEVYQCFRGAIASIIRAMKMEAVNTSETSVNFYETTPCNIPEDSHPQFVRHSFTSTLGFVNRLHLSTSGRYSNRVQKSVSFPHQSIGRIVNLRKRKYRWLSPTRFRCPRFRISAILFQYHELGGLKGGAH
jgi:hypothetical protein